MAKKSSKKKITKPSPKNKVKAGKRGRPKKPSIPVKPSVKGKKRGRKPSGVPNRYNSIKSTLSEYYENSVGRKIKRFELKIIYQFIKSNYSNQPLSYVLMNIDIILDTFWTEYCNLYPVDIANHERYFDWFLLKNTLNDEARYHYPTDIIEVDLSLIGEGIFEFYMEDFVSKSDEYYRICKEAGLKKASPPPALYLQSASCEVSRRGNVFKYILITDSDSIPSEPTQKPIPATSGDTSDEKQPELPAQKETQPESKESAPVTAPTQAPTTQAPDQNTVLEIEKEKIKKEYELKQQKLNQLKELLKEGIISFEQYLLAIKEV
jgi:hypothetical protein